MGNYNSHPIDMLMYRDDFGSPEMRAVFSEENLIKKWLQFDATIAEVEGELGIIPVSAAEEISKKAASGEVKTERVAELAIMKKLDIAGELSGLAEVCSENAREYIRLGVAGADNYDTAWALLIREALSLIYRQLDDLIDVFVELTRKHRNTLNVCRTFGQHEGPITFGWKTAMWAKELHHCRLILRENEKYYLVGKALGAIGNLAGLEKEYPGTGPLLVKRVCEKLKLGVPDLSIIFTRRRFMQLVVNLSFIANAVDGIALEIFNRQRPEIGELQEPFGKSQTSSTAAPHKRNPYGCNVLSGLAEVVRGNVSTILHSTWFDERDHRRVPIESTVIPTTFIHVSGMLKIAHRICKDLVVNPKRMLENLRLQKGLNFSEVIMTALATRGLGRYTARDLIQALAGKVYEEDADFLTILKSNEDITRYLTPEEIDDLVDPDTNLGLVQHQIDETLSEINGYNK